MRVLVLTNLWPSPQAHYGGTFIVSRLRALAPLGIDVTLCHLHYRPRSPREIAPSWKDFREHAHHCTALPAYRPSWRDYGLVKMSWPHAMEVGGKRHVERALSGHPRFDVIHAYGMYIPSAGHIAMTLARRLSVPYTVSLQGGDVNSATGRSLAMLRRVVAGASVVSYVSDALRARAETLGAIAPHSMIIPNGVDVDRFVPSAATEPRTSSRSPRRIVGYLGRLTKVKGADRLIEIVRCVHDCSPDVQFVIGGSGPLEGSLRRRARSLPVEFRGPISPDDVPAFLRGLDLLIIPSRNEGWPTVVFEAHACCVPVLGSDAGGTPDAIADDSYVVRNGPDFTRRFADRIVDVLERDEDRRELRSRAERYSWQEIARLEASMLVAACRHDRQVAPPTTSEAST